MPRSPDLTDAAQLLRSRIKGRVLLGVPLAPCTSYRLGGPADLAVFPQDSRELARVVRLLRDLALPRVVLGGGSNMLVSDRGVRGAVILTTEMTRLTVEHTRIVAEAGVPSHRVALAARDSGLSGAEFFAWLPGSVGGACMMNARAHGGEVSQILRQALLVTPAGRRTRRELRPDQFSYKRSPFQRGGSTIAEVTFQLAPGDRVVIQQRMETIEAHRRANHEMDYPSCGCVFKNDHRIGVPSGQLIEQCGLKGFSIGGAQVSPHHANFVINRGSASALDVRRVIEHVRRTVAQMTGHELELEVQIVGDWAAEEIAT